VVEHDLGIEASGATARHEGRFNTNSSVSVAETATFTLENGWEIGYGFSTPGAVTGGRTLQGKSIQRSVSRHT
jgi:hypothetical protein